MHDAENAAGAEGRFPRLGGAAALQRDAVGGKAAALSRLRMAGFRVPPGYVVTRAAYDDASGRGDWLRLLQDAALAAGPGPYAVRSSAAAEDLPGASYAGMYESYLNVEPAGLAAAVARCFQSAEAGRVRAYQESLGQAGSGAMAVLVQQMVEPTAAGVAFSANPLTGARDETVISAVPGLAEGLVSGSEGGEEWTVRNGSATCTRGGDLLTAEVATAVAAAAQRVAGHFGAPQDVEWALDRSGQVQLVQARPMTAVPEPVAWQRPGKGVWIRNFRLGEWLPEPVTPLFMDWLVPTLDSAYNRAVAHSTGVQVPMEHAAVNGWYYVAPPTPRALPHLLFGGSLRYIFNCVVRPMLDPRGADRAVLRSLEDEWRTECLPAYRRLAEGQPAGGDAAGLPDIIGQVEDVVGAAGAYLWYFSVTGGAAWKMEMALARFWRRHLAAAVASGVPAASGAEGYQVLLGGLLPSAPPRCPMPCTALTGTTGQRARSRQCHRHRPTPGAMLPPMPRTGAGRPRLPAVGPCAEPAGCAASTPSWPLPSTTRCCGRNRPATSRWAGRCCAGALRELERSCSRPEPSAIRRTSTSLPGGSSEPTDHPGTLRCPGAGMIGCGSGNSTRRSPWALCPCWATPLTG
ncbi:PEP/pyruvate-binding domain-containing protein [Arthrobacter sp. SD76]|uniref:PEP/pyruvate-binding domain-containing protein n=1 Tax=Arthrobacter sp. SD76 TaxID=3415007 RepID=UPI003C774E08